MKKLMEKIGHTHGTRRSPQARAVIETVIARSDIDAHNLQKSGISRDQRRAARDRQYMMVGGWR